MQQRTTRIVTVVILIVAATLAVYAQSFGAGFLTIDDGVYVTANPTVQAGLTATGARWAFGMHEANWHPLTWLSLMLDASIGGTTPGTFHVTNVLLHAANSLLLCFALFAMTGRLERSGFVALLFAVHPLHVESVAWIAERKDVLCGLFFMLGLLLWAAYVKRPSKGGYAWVALVLAFGLMAKPMLVTLPLVFLLLDRWPLERKASWRELIIEKVPLFALSAGSAVATMIAQRSGGAMSTTEVFPLSARAANAAVAYMLYLTGMVWPARLSFFYPYRGAALPAWQMAAAVLLIIAITVLAARTARTYSYIAVGWAWYLVTLIPVIGLVQVGLQARADRYTYLPLIGPFIAITWGAADLAGRVGDLRVRKALMGSVGCVVAVALIFTAHVEAGYWHDSIALYQRALAVTQDNATAHNDLGLALLERGDLDGTILHCKEALRLDPNHPEAPNHLATALSRKGQLAEAIAVYREAIRRRPGDVTFHSNLGTVFAEQGDFPSAGAEFHEALRLDPNSASAHYNMGVLLARERRFEAAVVELAAAQRLDPLDAQIRQSLQQARELASRAPKP